MFQTYVVSITSSFRGTVNYIVGIPLLWKSCLFLSPLLKYDVKKNYNYPVTAATAEPQKSTILQKYGQKGQSLFAENLM